VPAPPAVEAEPAAPLAPEVEPEPVAAASEPAAETVAAAPVDVAETMISPPGMAMDREPTTLMPAWQPPPAPPAAVAETLAITRPPVGAGATAVGQQGELAIESGPDAGHTHRAADHAVRLGRSPDNDVILRDPATSGHHARIERRGDQFWIVDLGSTNGTFVNGESVQEKQLNPGDRLTIGQNSVHFSLLGA
jgi:hypothetical protein